jgi:hypothetical protein
MAIVTELKKAQLNRPKAHPTHVVGHWSILRDAEANGPLFQLDTRGSEQRAKPGKQSQTLQLDSKSARQLFEILKREFGF